MEIPTEAQMERELLAYRTMGVQKNAAIHFKAYCKKHDLVIGEASAEALLMWLRLQTIKKRRR
jgi:hypothetical protein